MRLTVHASAVLLALSAACASARPVPTVHLADYSGSPPTGRFRVELAAGEAPLYAEPTPVLDDRDFTSASFARSASGEPLLRLCFAPGRRARFAEIAQQNVRRRLMFLIREKPVFAPIIDSGTVPECEEVRGAVTEEQAAAVQRAIR